MSSSGASRAAHATSPTLEARGRVIGPCRPAVASSSSSVWGRRPIPAPAAVPGPRPGWCGSTASTIPASSNPVLVEQQSLHDLPRCIAGQLVDDRDVAWDLVRRQPLLHVLLEIRLVCAAPRRPDKESYDALTERLVVDAEDRGLA